MLNSGGTGEVEVAKREGQVSDIPLPDSHEHNPLVFPTVPPMRFLVTTSVNGNLTIDDLLATVGRDGTDDGRKGLNQCKPCKWHFQPGGCRLATSGQIAVCSHTMKSSGNKRKGIAFVSGGSWRWGK